MSKEIKIIDAKKIANDYDYDMVIIIGVNNDSSGHITTYGKTKNRCKVAGYLGQKKLAPAIFGEDGILANFDYEKDILDKK